MLGSTLLVACQAFNQGDDVSSAAKLDVKSDGQAVPSEPVRNLLSQSVAFKIGQGVNQENQQALPEAGTLLVIKQGKAYLCLDQKVDGIWNCGGVNAFPDDGHIQFDTKGTTGTATYRLEASNLPLRSGDVLIDPGALRVYIDAIDYGSGTQLHVVRQLTYVKQSELGEMKLLDAANNGKTLDLSGSNTAPSAPPAKADTEALKREVITQVAVEHNFNPSDVVGYDATVEAAPGREEAYIVRGKFQVESDTPSNVYEAASARINQNICMVSPDDCAGKKFKHTVEFEATAKEFTKLDGSQGLNIEDKVAVDKPLNPPAPAQVQPEQAAPAQTAAAAQTAPHHLYICRTAEGNEYTNVPKPGCEEIGGKKHEAEAVKPQPVPDRDLALTYRIEPRYPPQAVRQGHEGRVTIDLVFDEQGNVADAKVHESSGFRELDRAAIETARRWKARPAIHNGVVVKSAARFPIDFSLNRI